MKICVLGGCQAIPLAESLRLMLPNVRVERHGPFVDTSTLAGEDDLVFRQRNRRTVWQTHELRANELLYPRVWFNAFHPDLVNVAGPAGAALPPLGDYHSSLVLYAWNRKLSARETVRLFCEPVFEHLGFFGYWEPAKRTLLEEGRGVEFPLEAMFARWERRGRFMLTTNHPALFVMADLARALAERAGLAPAFDAPDDYVSDPMLLKDVWPIYPEVGRRLGLPGAYAFKPAQRDANASALLLGLDEFVERSFEAYAHMTAEQLACLRLEDPRYRGLERVAAGAPRPSRNGTSAAAPRATPGRESSPYAELPDERFWRRAVERVPPAEVDPVGTPPFAIGRRTRIATAGSCFAQHMSRVLVQHGYNYLVAEPAPAELTAEQARLAGYGVFSTRCGNVYTARQLLQLFERAYGTLVPREEAWLRPDGRYADPFRPLIEPDGFATHEALRDARERHLAAVRAMFERLDVLIFTLGLTEAWRSKADGAVYPLAPGVAAGLMDPSQHEFVNFTAAEVRDDLRAFLRGLGAVNPSARVVLTVSPQPPIATYEPRHVLVAATYTKAALRVAADEVERLHPEVWYFPGYELVASAFNRGAYYAPDLRSVTPAGVEHVMRLFLARCAADEPDASALDARHLDENRAAFDVECDEEAIAPEHEQFLDRAIPAINPQPAAARAPVGTMHALPAASMRARFGAALPSTMRARAIVTVACTVTNEGDIALGGGAPHPVFLCYRWFDERGEPAEVGESIHTELPAPLEPGGSAELAMRIAAPRYDGHYRLRVTLLQSEVAWFDDVDPASGLAADVLVTANSATPARA